MCRVCATRPVELTQNRLTQRDGRAQQTGIRMRDNMDRNRFEIGSKTTFCQETLTERAAAQERH